jgi:hypothetical protein
VRLLVAGAEADVRSVLAEFPASEFRATSDGIFEVLLKTSDQRVIDRLVDSLRGRSVSVISMSPRRQTLEEAFLDMLERYRSGA